MSMRGTKMQIIDTHMHLCSPDLQKYPALKDQPGGMSSTAFRWFGSSTGNALNASVAALQERMHSKTRSAEWAVDKAFNITPGWYGFDNSFTIAALHGNRDWLACGVLVDPTLPGAAAELRRLVGQGACGLRIQPPVTGLLTDPAQTPIWEAAAALGVTVDVNQPQAGYNSNARMRAHPGGEPVYSQIGDRARQFPGVKIVLDHCGFMSGGDPPFGPGAVDAALELARFPNCYAKLTFAASATQQEFPWADTHGLYRQLIDAFGADRCLWGSNFCGEDQLKYDQAINLFATEFDCTAAEREWIMGGTATKLWTWESIDPSRL